MQAALAWFGHYEAAVDGAFGPGTRAAIAAWQQAQGLPATGVLTRAERQRLLGARAALEAELGLEPVTESEAGIAFSLPAALVEFDRYDPPFVRYRPRGDSGIRLALVSLPGDEAALAALLARIEAEGTIPSGSPPGSPPTIPPGGRREAGGRAFTLEGAGPGGGGRARVALAGGLIKGWILLWEPGAEARAARVAEALEASFRAVGSRALDPGLVALAPGLRDAMRAGTGPAPAEATASGFYVSATGQVLTAAAAVQGCAGLTIDRGIEAEVTMTDPALGVALLTPRRPLAPPAVAALARALPLAGAEVAVAGYSWGPALRAPALAWGTLAAPEGLDGEPDLARLALAARPGDAGGPVLDATGAVAGMLLPAGGAQGRVLPADVAFLRPAALLAPALAAAGIAPAAAPQGALAPADLVARARAITVLVTCRR